MPSASSGAEPALELAHEGAFQVHLDTPPSLCQLPPQELLPLDASVRIPVVTSQEEGTSGYYELSSYDLRCLDDFHTTVKYTLGSGTSRHVCHIGSKEFGEKVSLNPEPSQCNNGAPKN